MFQADGGALTQFLATLAMAQEKPRDVLLPTAATVTFSTTAAKVAQNTQRRLAIDGARDLPATFPPTVEDVAVTSKKLTAIPNQVLQLKNLKRLELSDNKISSIPKEFSALTLAVLDLSFNGLIEFPPHACIPSLRSLNLSHNKIKTLCGFSQMSSLETLDVSENGLV